MARYISREFGKKAVEKFSQNINQWVRTIACNPGIGFKEPLLEKHPEGFRSVVVHRNCKLVYYVTAKAVYIAALWDTRREPVRQAGTLR